MLPQMAGGFGKRHGHPGSLRVFSLQRYKSFENEIKGDDQAFGNLTTTESIQKCTSSCLMFNIKTKRCDAIGATAPEGDNCKAQLISRRER